MTYLFLFCVQQKTSTCINLGKNKQIYFEQKEHFLHFLRELIPLIHSKKKKKNSPKEFKYDVVLIRSIFHCSELSKLSITQDVLYNIYVFLIP